MTQYEDRVQKQKDKLKEHSKHHTTEHMTIMKKMMKGGVSFTKAHNLAKKMVGKSQTLFYRHKKEK